MTLRRRRTRLVGWALTPLLVVALSAPLLGPLAGLHAAHPTAAHADPGSAALAQMNSVPLQWANGVVALNFPTPYPTYTVTALSDARVAAAGSLVGIAELNATGNVKAYAKFDEPTVNWTFHESAVPGGQAVQLSAAVTVVPSSGHWESGDEVARVSNGNASHATVNLVFLLNASSAPNPATIRFTVNVTGWPWLHLSDSLGLELGLVASSSAQIVRGTSTYNLVTIDPGTRSTIAKMEWGAQAAIGYGNGATGVSSVGSYRNISTSAANSTVRITFAGVTGGYSRVSYDPWIQLNLTAFRIAGLPAWVVSPLSVAVIEIGAGVAIVLAVVAVRLRSRPDPEELR